MIEAPAGEGGLPIYDSEISIPHHSSQPSASISRSGCPSLWWLFLFSCSPSFPSFPLFVGGRGMKSHDWDYLCRPQCGVWEGPSWVGLGWWGEIVGASGETAPPIETGLRLWDFDISTVSTSRPHHQWDCWRAKSKCSLSELAIKIFLISLYSSTSSACHDSRQSLMMISYDDLSLDSVRSTSLRTHAYPGQ